MGILSNRIESNLRNAVSRGEVPSYRLTLPAMAEHFKVSIQPVRTAVDALLKDRWLLRNEQGRLALNPAKKGEAFDAPPTSPEEKSFIRAELEKIIIQHSLRGEEVFLREEETADQLGVGRTVLRAELIRLHGRGLVDHLPRRGWRVIGYNELRMLEYLEIRETLELKALELAMNNLEERTLRRLCKRNTPDARGRTRIDDALHHYFVERSGNRFIKGFFEQHGAYHTALFNYVTLAGSYLVQQAEQHREILQALLDGNHGQARRSLSRHIRSQRGSVAELLDCVAGEAQ